MSAPVTFTKKSPQAIQSVYIAARQGGRGPCENLRSKISRGEGGMTERYEKSPAFRLGFLNGAQSIPTCVCVMKLMPAPLLGP